MSHAMGSWRSAQRQMGRLTPVAEVAAGLVADDTMVGLHVRTVFDAPRDDATARTALGEAAVRAAESEYGTEGVRRLMQWRNASHWSHFVPPIAALLQAYRITRTSACSPTPSTGPGPHNSTRTIIRARPE